MSTSPLPVMLVLALAAAAAPAAPAAEGGLRAGDRWLAIGDSITQGGLYHSLAYLFLRIRHPERPLEHRNAGISGDTVGGALRRWPWDIEPAAATVATVMFGMNDVGRGLYATDASATNIADRASRLASYRHEMGEFAALLRTAGTRVVWLTPSPYAEDPAQPTAGIDAALRTCSEIVHDLAADDEIVVDIHAAMHRTGALDDLIGDDRVHPDPSGHLVMAATLLTALGCHGDVYELSLDLHADEPVIAARSCVLRDLHHRADGIDLEVDAPGLPLALPSELDRRGVGLADRERWNRELLRITGLPDARYRITADGSRLTVVTAAQLEAGVDLGAFRRGPRYQRSLAIGHLVLRRHEWMVMRRRVPAMVRHHTLSPTGVDVSDAAAVERVLTASLDENQGKPLYGWLAVNYDRYRRFMPIQDDIDADIAFLDEQIAALAAPRPLIIGLVREPSP